MTDATERQGERCAKVMDVCDIRRDQHVDYERGHTFAPPVPPAEPREERCRYHSEYLEGCSSCVPPREDDAEAEALLNTLLPLPGRGYEGAARDLARLVMQERRLADSLAKALAISWTSKGGRAALAAHKKAREAR